MNFFTPLEHHQYAVLSRMEIIRKCGTVAAVLLTKDLRECIECPIDKQHLVGVEKDNEFLLARLSCRSMNHIRDRDVLRFYSTQCGAKYPQNIRSTRLRHHIATISQMVNLKENELGVLARFLGHDNKTHCEYYRLPVEAVQVAKVSKLLLSLESGNISAIQNKLLDDIQLDLDKGKIKLNLLLFVH